MEIMNGKEMKIIDEKDLPYLAEYAKSGRSKCKKCNNLIEKKCLRLAVIMQSSFYDGKVQKWYHLDCFFLEQRLHSEGDIANFVNLRILDQKQICKRIDQFTNFDSETDLPSFNQLPEYHLDLVSQSVIACEVNGIPAAKKIKIEVKEKIDILIERQNESFYKYRDLCGKVISKKDVISILEYNSQIPYPRNTDKLYSQFGDLLAFGALLRCESCHEGQFYFNTFGYLCNGNSTDWAKCKQLVNAPDKIECEIPDELRQKYVVLTNYEGNIEVRAFKNVPPSSKTLNEIFNKENYFGISTEYIPQSKKITLKDGLAVDPDSGLANEANVYKDESGNAYSEVLTLTDIQEKKNSYYKLQLLEYKSEKRYFVFRSWGRIGTDIGDSKINTYDTINEAIEIFVSVYKQKTGNDYEEREYSSKVPNKYQPVEVDYKYDNVKLNLEYTIESKLPVSVQDLIKLIFDVDIMKNVMMEFHLDIEKMPLGKLSEQQIESARNVLSELSEMIQKNTGTDSKFIDVTNRFYTLIPHNFGIDNPPILKTAEQIKTESEKLDFLMELVCVYNIYDEVVDKNKNPIDHRYERLKTELIPLEKSSENYKLIQKYVKNTHAETHLTFNLEILDIFKVARENEPRYIDPLKKLHNRKLLWHGSRLINYAGILSQGLKKAPQEAQSNGSMFGKGIYFADMVTKSANYCFTTKKNSTGLMLLCEVALGNMIECAEAQYVPSLSEHYHSIKGMGKSYPNPEDSHIIDGVEIPLGKPIKDENITSELLYNEYIVYDVAQVNIQYLCKMKFNYNY